MGSNGDSGNQRATIGVLLVLVLALAAPSHAGDTRGGAPENENQVTVQPTLADIVLYERTHAIIIGIDKYPELDGEDQLEYAVGDARAVEALLREKYEFDSITTLYDEEASRVGIEKAFQTAGNTMGKDDALFIFWAGHGLIEDSRHGKLGYLVPYDGNRKDPIARNISMGYLRDTVFRSVDAKHVFLVVDACYGGLFADTRDLDDREAVHTPEYLREITNEDAVQVLTAGKEDQQVLDGGGLGADGLAHSVFAQRFLQTLSEAGDFITAREIGMRIKPLVVSDAAKQGKEQSPVFRPLWGVGDFVFVPRQRSTHKRGSHQPAAAGAEGLLTDAWAAYYAGDFEGGITLGMQAMTKNPALYEAILVRGLSYERQGDSGRAKALLEQYSELLPPDRKDLRVSDALARIEALPRPGLSSPGGPSGGSEPVPVARAGVGLVDSLRAIGPSVDADAWDTTVGRLVLEAFDQDGSGSIDRADELEVITCDVYKLLDGEVQERWRHDMRTLYGFERGAYMGNVLGFSVSLRSRVDAALALCVGAGPPAQADGGAGSQLAVPGPLGLRGDPGTPTWEGSAEQLLIADFDLDKSGEIDNATELAKIPCSTWRALEQPLRSTGHGLHDYGLGSGRWRGNRLGFSRKIKDEANAAVNACLSQ